MISTSASIPSNGTGNAPEKVFYEGGPHRLDLIFSLIFGLTVVGIPLTVGAVVRALWLRFRITDRRVSVSGGWLGRDRSQVSYSQIREVRSVARGLGFYGDLVLVLKDGKALEMRSLPNHRGTVAFIEERMSSTGPRARASRSGGEPASRSGFAA
ncbi:MAG: PH domain-containing protein [Aphanocapsa feldmannii 288cV]|nr:MAG: PH domain-containing protein [Aphanocapsa feldmannii 288cV]